MDILGSFFLNFLTFFAGCIANGSVFDEDFEFDEVESEIFNLSGDFFGNASIFS